MVQKNYSLKKLFINNFNFKSKHYLSEKFYKNMFKIFNKKYLKYFLKYFYIYINNILTIFNINKINVNFYSFKIRASIFIKYFIKNNNLNFSVIKKKSTHIDIFNYKKLLLFYRW